MFVSANVMFRIIFLILMSLLIYVINIVQIFINGLNIMHFGTSKVNITQI